MIRGFIAGSPRWRTQSVATLLLLASLGSSAYPAGQDKEACRRDAMIVFDASGSMFIQDMEGRPRIDVARDVVVEIMPTLTESRRTGLIIYGPGGQCHVSLKLFPTEKAASAIISEIIQTRPAGGTPLGAGVLEAAGILGSGLVVLVTDGEENCGIDPCRLGQSLRAQSPGITVHVIGIRMGPAAETKAACLATETGGIYAPVNSHAELKHALTEVMTCPKISERRPRRNTESLTRLAALESR